MLYKKILFISISIIAVFYIFTICNYWYIISQFYNI